MTQDLHRPRTQSARRSRDFLADPEPRPRYFTIISVDDHVIEPPDTFTPRVPAKFVDRAPRVITTKTGKQVWLYEDRAYPNVGLNAIAGYPKEQWGTEPARFDEMRPGCYNIHERIKDMDIAGIHASADIEEWAAPYPERIIPVQITWLADCEIAADDVRRNRARLQRRHVRGEPDQPGMPSLTRATGTRSCAPARKPRRWSASMSARGRSCRRLRPTRRSRCP